MSQLQQNEGATGGAIVYARQSSYPNRETSRSEAGSPIPLGSDAYDWSGYGHRLLAGQGLGQLAYGDQVSNGDQEYTVTELQSAAHHNPDLYGNYEWKNSK